MNRPGITQSTVNDPLEIRVSTVAGLTPMWKRVINPETGEEVPPNTVGEIVTRGYHDEGLLQDARSHCAGDRQGRLAAHGDLGMKDSRGITALPAA